MPYLGSKTAQGVPQAIIAAMPPHDTYIETHLGSGAILAAKPAAARSIGLDIDRDVISRAIEALGGACDLVAVDCVAFLETFDFTTAGRVLVYADPPYVMATRCAVRPKTYRHDYSDQDHRRLCEALRALPGNVKVMLSGYPSTLYDELVGDWRSIEFQAATRGGPRTEKLWMNYPADAAHWATFAGVDFTDRQRIKRKAARWCEMFYALPPGERVAILAAILNGPEA